ncbi:MAG TPA: hypothetical protein VNY73_03460, partial [Bacteroidia bacterium]|nr:hypothetical protein [Bacteroidia bacterium]
FYRTEMEGFRKKIAKKERDIKSTKDQLSSAKFHMESYIKTPEQITAAASMSIAKWDEIKNGYDEANYHSIFDLNSYFKEYRLSLRTRRTLATDLEQLEKTINKIEQAITFQGKIVTYKILDFREILQLKCTTSIAIPVQEQHSMFPVYNEVLSLEQLLSYQNKQAGYLFAINPIHILDKLAKQKSDLELKIAEAVSAIPDYQAIVTAKIKGYYDRNYELTKSHFDGWNKQLERYSTELAELINEMDSFHRTEQIMIESSNAEMEKQLEADRSMIMKRWKGLYGFRWKNERKSWSETGCPVFFDIGKDYLFQRTGSTMLKKVSLEKFLNKYNP